MFPLLDLINQTKIEARKEQFHYYTRMFTKNHYEDDILATDYSKYHNDALIEAQQYFASLNPHGKIQDLFRLQPLERIELPIAKELLYPSLEERCAYTVAGKDTLIPRYRHRQYERVQGSRA